MLLARSLENRAEANHTLDSVRMFKKSKGEVQLTSWMGPGPLNLQTLVHVTHLFMVAYDNSGLFTYFSGELWQFTVKQGASIEFRMCMVTACMWQSVRIASTCSDLAN